jgi:dihydrodiol dehydrogenase / D-xylose 1-dehydrogenase (NADP)
MGHYRYVRNPSCKSITNLMIIAGPGRIASWFVSDLQLSRPDAQAVHTVTAVGSSSLEKGTAFVEKNLASQAVTPAVYGSYAGVYADSNVDIVYISTPHAVHKSCVLEAVAAGKHVLCEKPMAINAAEAEEMINAAKEKGVFLMEGT